jgi:hypothetical protein
VLKRAAQEQNYLTLYMHLTDRLVSTSTLFKTLNSKKGLRV